MKEYLEKFFLMFFIVFAWPLMAATISGTVKDSSTGNKIVGAQVKCSAPVCSTQTDADGKFTLNIPSTECFSPGVFRTKIKIFFDPSRNLFYGNGQENYFKVRNAKGELMARGDKLSPGEYFASSSYGTFKFLNVAGQRWFFVPNGMEKKGMNKVTSGYTVIFVAPSYNQKIVTLSGGQNVQVDLVQVVNNGSLSVSDTLGHVGQTTINITVPPVSPSP
jgi:hypothetical protein